MKCESCGAPVEDGKCTYCGRDYSTPHPKPQQSNTSDKYVKPVSPKDGSARTSKKYQYTPSSTRPKSKKKSSRDMGEFLTILSFRYLSQWQLFQILRISIINNLYCINIHSFCIIGRLRPFFFAAAIINFFNIV